MTMDLFSDPRKDPRVAVAKLSSSDYRTVNDELSSALERALGCLRWQDGAEGQDSAAKALNRFGPFGRIIPSGARVLIKPNFVLHENQGPGGMDPLVTHPSLVRAVVQSVLRSDPAEVIVGDAPLQGCDFGRLMDITGLGQWAEALMKRDPRFKGVADFRRTTCVFVDGVRKAKENIQSAENFVLFDLGKESLLEPLSNGRDGFRVTCYDPRLLAQTHHAGRHQYLVAREVIEADVIINMPKLKTHKKAGITCALKNLIGINGNKEYLPHHRIGGSNTGGDCYPGGSLLKRALEFTSDREHTTSSFAMSKVWHNAGVQFQRALRLMGDQLGTEGSWSGNDTIWRTCLDLNRILLYGRADATLADSPQRQVVHVVDAIVAGQGDGPLAPLPLPMGLIIVGQNAAAVDWIGAHLLGYEPSKVSIVREGFRKFRWPLASFPSCDVVLLGGMGTGFADEVFEKRRNDISVIYPVGWQSAARQ
ncbi:MAG: DUF362 domain-containing protein [Blastocatellia bacterium]|nr:DUF362 domain-containing protein [Blastocatellia bacterium]